MAIFTMSYSLAHILSAKMGMAVIDWFGYQSNWLFMGTLGLIGTALGYWVISLIAIEKSSVKY